MIAASRITHHLLPPVLRLLERRHNGLTVPDGLDYRVHETVVLRHLIRQPKIDILLRNHRVVGPQHRGVSEGARAGVVRIAALIIIRALRLGEGHPTLARIHPTPLLPLANNHPLQTAAAVAALPHAAHLLVQLIIPLVLSTTTTTTVLQATFRNGLAGH